MDEDKNITKISTQILVQTVPRGLKISDVSSILALQKNNLIKDPKWRIRAYAVGDMCGILRENWITFGKSADISPLINMLYDPEIEVRKAACNGLSTIFQLLSDEMLLKLTTEFKSKANELLLKITSTDPKLKETQNIIALHGHVLGLLALTYCQATEIPKRIPDLLTYICKFSNNYGTVSESVRMCLSIFWKWHKPKWEYQKHKFTEEQQVKLSEHINPYNYFA